MLSHRRSDCIVIRAPNIIISIIESCLAFCCCVCFGGGCLKPDMGWWLFGCFGKSKRQYLTYVLTAGVEFCCPDFICIFVFSSVFGWFVCLVGLSTKLAEGIWVILGKILFFDICLWWLSEQFKVSTFEHVAGLD